MAKCVSDIVTASGGRCLVNHPVAEIVMSDDTAEGVRIAPGGDSTAPGAVYEAPIVVSDAGAYTTFCRLLPAIPFRCELERLSAGHSFVTVYLGDW